MTAAEIAERLKKARPCSGGFTGCCPAHDDDNPSLSVGTGEDGRVLLNCHAHGCKAEDIVAALGLEMTDLFPARWDAPPPECKGFGPDFQRWDLDEQKALDDLHAALGGAP